MRIPFEAVTILCVILAAGVGGNAEFRSCTANSAVLGGTLVMAFFFDDDLQKVTTIRLRKSDRIESGDPLVCNLKKGECRSGKFLLKEKRNNSLLIEVKNVTEDMRGPYELTIMFSDSEPKTHHCFLGLTGSNEKITTSIANDGNVTQVSTTTSETDSFAYHLVTPGTTATTKSSAKNEPFGTNSSSTKEPTGPKPSSRNEPETSTSSPSNATATHDSPRTASSLHNEGRVQTGQADFLPIVIAVSMVVALGIIIAIVSIFFRMRIKRLCSKLHRPDHPYVVREPAPDMVVEGGAVVGGQAVLNATEISETATQDTGQHTHYPRSTFAWPRHQHVDRSQMTADSDEEKSDGNQLEDTEASQHDTSDQPLLKAHSSVNLSEVPDGNPYEAAANSGVYGKLSVSEDTAYRQHDSSHEPLLKSPSYVILPDALDSNPDEDGEDKPPPCRVSVCRVYVTKDNRQQSWYFGRLTGEEELALLMSPSNGHGSFLVRDSNSQPNRYTLSVRFGHKVYCYRIDQKEECSGFYIDDGLVFHTLSDLIQHYTQHRGSLLDTLLAPCQHSH